MEKGFEKRKEIHQLYPILVHLILFGSGYYSSLRNYSSITNTIDIEIIFLYLAGIFWTLGYDTIYAHQDREDDLKIGIKSTAILFDKNSKFWISTFYVVMLGFLIFYGIFSNVNLIYYIALIFVGLHLINQIIKLDIDNSEICLKLFKSNSILGLLVCACLIVNIL